MLKNLLCAKDSNDYIYRFELFIISDKEMEARRAKVLQVARVEQGLKSTLIWKGTVLIYPVSQPKV